MAIKTLICGLSGTGKSRSMKEFAEQGVPVAVVNPVNKPLPFRNKFEMLNGETDSRKIVKFMKAADAKVIVVDDFQYLLSVPYMRRIKESGWDKYNDFAANYFDIISICDELPEDTTVYFMTHTETLEDGTETVKLIGKLLREKICIEGLFTIVLKTLVNDGHYYFLTQNNGKDTTKSPEDMFPSLAIDNNLKYVDDKIRNYYNVAGAMSDEEMAAVDQEEKREDVTEDDVKGKKKRGRKPKSEEEESSSTSRTRESFEKAKRKTRGQVKEENAAAVANAGLEEAGEDVEVPFENVEEPKMEKVPPKRRERKKRDVETDHTLQESAETAGTGDAVEDSMPAPAGEAGEDKQSESAEAAENGGVPATGRRRRRRS